MNAFMSLLNLFRNNSNFEQEGKLATLWFDKLLLGTDENHISKVIGNVAEKENWCSDTIKEVRKIHIPSEDILPKVSFTDSTLIDESIYRIATGIMQTDYKSELNNPTTYGGAMHEVIMGSAGITTSVKYWMLLNAKNNCTFLPMKSEQQILKKLFNYEADNGFNNFNNVITSIIPDISEYSWDEIIELRHHNYWSQFRKKLSELNLVVSDKKLASEIVEEIVHKDLVEMAIHVRPNVGKNTVKGIISNIPLPIPINPLSVVCTGCDIIKEIDFEKKYGWIYFYLDNKK